MADDTLAPIVPKKVSRLAITAALSNRLLEGLVDTCARDLRSLIRTLWSAAV